MGLELNFREAAEMCDQVTFCCPARPRALAVLKGTLSKLLGLKTLTRTDKLFYIISLPEKITTIVLFVLFQPSLLKAPQYGFICPFG